MGIIGFGTPPSVLTGGASYSTDATEINDGGNGFTAVTPPPTDTPVSLAPPTADPSLAGANGFNLPGSAAQNMITDPNLVGVQTPSGMSFSPAPLLNPNPGNYNYHDGGLSDAGGEYKGATDGGPYSHLDSD